MKKVFFLYTIVILSYNSVFAQIKYKLPDSREVIITSSDSIIKARISTQKYTGKTDNDATYYWYYANTIHYNKGGFTGNLLHGRYQVFTSDDQLILLGNFNHGLKTGEWKEWYSNGQIKTITHWKKGLKHGIFQAFTVEGKQTRQAKFKNGVLHGYMYIYYPDGTADVRRYKNGEEVVIDASESQAMEEGTGKRKKKLPAFIQKFLSLFKKKDTNEESIINE